MGMGQTRRVYNLPGRRMGRDKNSPQVHKYGDCVPRRGVRRQCSPKSELEAIADARREHSNTFFERAGMGVLVVVLFGMILGQFFKCFVLIPASGLAIILVLA